MTVYVSDQLAAVPATVKGDPTPATSWQWLRNNQPISGATSSTYDVGSVDLGSELSVIQQAINVIGSASSISVGTGTVADFTPSLMYRGGANGVWYDPSDFSTLFQDAAGTTPVTAVGQPVGLMLDKSKGLVLGNAVATPDFTQGAWTKSAAITSYSALSFTASSAGGVYKAANDYFTVGKLYSISVSYTKTSSTTTFSLVNVVNGTASTPVVVSGNEVSGTLIGYCLPLTTGGVYFRLSGADAVTITSISVRELPGNHAFNPSGNSANFPVLSARYNLLTKTEDFNSSTWSYSKAGTGVTPVVTPNFTTAPDGSTTAVRIQLDVGSGVAGSDISYITQPVTNSATSILRCFFKLNSGASKVITFRCGSTLQQITVTDQWKEFSVGDSIGHRADIMLYGNVGGGGSVDLLAWHPDLRVSNDALNQPAYQRVNTANDYDTAGFKPYLSFNGVNQWLQTNSIDFTYGDKMFVSAGVRKLSDAAAANILELSSIYVNPGAFAVFAPTSASARYGFISNGMSSSLANTAPSYVAPITNVISGIGNISGDQAILRVNGTQAAIDATDQGTGNYGNYPLYIGARAGSSLWFNGRLYGLIIVGKAVRSVEITSTEAWLNSKTGAY